jgi:ribonuclease E
MKNKKIIINSTPEEVRIALLEGDRLERFQAEGIEGSNLKGNIYKGTIINIEYGLQAIFVDAGLPRNVYLQFSEIHPEYMDEKGLSSLKKGQEIVIQLEKDETELKGAAASTYLFIPGRYLVLTPGTDQSGVSRKIEDEKERTRLKNILKEFKTPDGVGLIARTVSEGVSKQDIKKDLNYLMRLWESIRKKAGSINVPACIYQDRDIVIRFLRDFFENEISQIHVDDPDEYQTIKSFLKVISPRKLPSIHLYKGNIPIFQHFKIESQVEELFSKRVNLPSGGYIIIEPTEALVSIDVNSGKHIREKNMEEIALKTNLEAAEEVARQLRFRDLGGIIVVDFIDMKSASYRKRLVQRFRECLKKDKARTEVSSISRFGLIEMVRQRMGPAIHHIGRSTCPCCLGVGTIKSLNFIVNSHLRMLRSFLATNKSLSNGQKIQVSLPQKVALYFLNKKKTDIASIEKEYRIEISINIDANLVEGQYNIQIPQKDANSVNN